MFDYRRLSEVLEKENATLRSHIAELEVENTKRREEFIIMCDRLISKEARIAELEALTTWQPIETCPKNKDVLLLIMGEIAKGFYSPKIKQFEAEGCYYHDISCNLVTHWMPLPKPPEEK